mmetsp:Transcript_86928/g.246466  ORF Transcript_86928/g.246466 Transcript_86928/m.246466 type:complete len:207 (-) Transcript_86928:1741-2361(-)
MYQHGDSRGCEGHALEPLAAHTDVALRLADQNPAVWTDGRQLQQIENVRVVPNSDASVVQELRHVQLRSDGTANQAARCYGTLSVDAGVGRMAAVPAAGNPARGDGHGRVRIDLRQLPGPPHVDREHVVPRARRAARCRGHAGVRRPDHAGRRGPGVPEAAGHEHCVDVGGRPVRLHDQAVGPDAAQHQGRVGVPGLVRNAHGARG